MEQICLTVRWSYVRCCASQGFFDDFYDVFLAKSPEVAEKFANTDFSHQKRMLKDSIFLMLEYASDDSKAQAEIERLGHVHSRANRDIRPELYELWLDSLCEVVKKHDPDHAEGLENVWRKCMRPGIETITSHY